MQFGPLLFYILYLKETISIGWIKRVGGLKKAIQFLKKNIFIVKKQESGLWPLFQPVSDWKVEMKWVKFFEVFTRII